MKKIKIAEYDSEIKEGIVLVDFYADWCGPCKMLAPVLEDVEKTYGDKVKFIKVNVDEEPIIAQRYGVMSIPTLLLIKDGVLVKQETGYKNKQMLVNFIG